MKLKQSEATSYEELETEETISEVIAEGREIFDGVDE
jgi:hypothetical protein